MRLLGAMAVLAAVLAGTSGAAPGARDAFLVAVGDVASCTAADDEATAGLVSRLPGTVAVLGDAVYERGSPREFSSCYRPSWGRFKARTRPAPGNHEYLTPGASGYFAYFGRAAGRPGQGWYSYELGAWHVVVLNSNCGEIGGCGRGSPQAEWLARDLGAHRRPCTVAYWHHPRFSSGTHGDEESMAPIWQILYARGVDLVLNGHDHDYERFAPQTPAGKRYPARGIRQIVVGTGGRSLRPFEELAPNSVARSWKAYGVLALRLSARSYSWRFVPVRPRAFADAGSAACH